jgi:hypothetical protein
MDYIYLDGVFIFIVASTKIKTVTKEHTYYRFIQRDTKIALENKTFIEIYRNLSITCKNLSNLSEIFEKWTPSIYSIETFAVF